MAVKIVRKRNHSCICYLPLNRLEEILQTNIALIDSYAYMYHDKDIKEDGTPKEPHTHLVISFLQPRSIQNVRSMFSVTIDNEHYNCLDAFTNNKILSLQYLTHKNDKDKYQYNAEEVVFYNMDYLDIHSQDAEIGDSLQNALYDLMSGKSYIYCVKKYGRDYIINHNRLKNLVDDIVDQEHYRAKSQTIDLQTGEVTQEHDLVSAFEIAQENKKENL